MRSTLGPLLMSVPKDWYILGFMSFKFRIQFPGFNVTKTCLLLHRDDHGDPAAAGRGGRWVGGEWRDVVGGNTAYDPRAPTTQEVHGSIQELTE